MSTFLNRLKHFIWIGLFLCITTGNAVGAEQTDEELNQLHKQYMDQFWSYLLESQHEQLRIAAAIRLLRTDNPSKKARGMQLISDVLEEPDIDPAALWLIALDCRWRKTADWCASGEALERLEQADPRNAAVQVLKLSIENQTLSDDEKHQLLAKMADAERDDIYWARGADKVFKEALRFVERNETPPAPYDFPVDILPHVYAYILITEAIVTDPTFPYFSYSEVYELCKEQAARQYAEGVQSCRALADIMQNYGSTLFNRSMGLGIERTMLEITNPDDPELYAIDLRKKANGVMTLCFTQLWTSHIEQWPSVEPARMLNYLINQDQLGEWGGLRLTLEQEFELSPENFAVNPAECNAVLEMDDALLDKFFAGRTVFEVWDQMQADAKAKSKE